MHRTHNEHKPNKRRVMGAVIAGVLAVTIVLTGTYAWTAFFQNALNETKGGAAPTTNPGGRLHDDFNGTNKDVYVENYGDQDIFVRVRLSEYMEIGGKPLDSHALKSDRGTWTPHNPLSDVKDCNNADDGKFHDYWTWTVGGEKVFMPTFDRDNNSLKTDIQGPSDWDGNYTSGYDHQVTDPNRGGAVTDEAGNENLYGNGGANNQNREVGSHNEYSAGDTVSGTQWGTGGSNSLETHTALATVSPKQGVPNGGVVTMAWWKTNNKPTGNFWVIDEDGWAYWASALAPGAATSLLLSEITLKTEPNSEWYYAIDAVGEFASKGDVWGKGGFGDTSNPGGNDLLEVITGNGLGAKKAQIDMEVGDTFDANSNLTKPSGGSISWTSGNTAVATIDANGVITAVSPGTAHITGTVSGGVNNGKLIEFDVVVAAPVSTELPLIKNVWNPETDGANANPLALAGWIQFKDLKNGSLRYDDNQDNKNSFGYFPLSDFLDDQYVNDYANHPITVTVVSGYPQSGIDVGYGIDIDRGMLLKDMTKTPCVIVSHLFSRDEINNMTVDTVNGVHYTNISVTLTQNGKTSKPISLRVSYEGIIY